MIKIIRSKLTHKDKSDAFDLLQNNEVMKFLGPRRALTNIEANDWFKNELLTTHRFVFRLESNNELIGFCGITDMPDTYSKHSNIELDFGYFIRQKFWGNGFAKIMCKQSIYELQKEIDLADIKVFIADDNHASQKIPHALNWIKAKPKTNENESGWVFNIPLNP